MKEKDFRTRILMLALSVVLGAFIAACESGGGDDSKDSGDGGGDGGGCQYSSINGTWQCTMQAGGGCDGNSRSVTLTQTGNQVTWVDYEGSHAGPLNGNNFVVDTSDPAKQAVETTSCTIINNCSMNCRVQGQDPEYTWDCIVAFTR